MTIQSLAASGPVTSVAEKSPVRRGGDDTGVTNPGEGVVSRSKFGAIRAKSQA
jgi:hypothetical protein